jgi:hypothetical protein
MSPIVTVEQQRRPQPQNESLARRQTMTSLSKKTISMTALALALALGVPAFASADTSVSSGRTLAETPVLPEGLSLQLGGGVTAFSREEARDVLGTGAYWDLRAAYGTRSFLGAELAYTGSAREIDAGSGDAALIGNGAEATVRGNLPLALGDFRLTPFAFGGVGWTYFQKYEDSGVTVSGMKDDAHALTIPFGAGVGLNYGRLALDARFTYRPVFDDDLVTAQGGKDTVDLQNWAVGLTVGYEL